MTPRFPLFTLSLTALLAGCDGVLPQRTTQHVSVDMSPLFRLAESETLAHCASVADEIVLTVTDAGGSEQQYNQALSLEEATVRFDVTVEPGEATFSVSIWSNNATLLYAGQQTTEVADDFEVRVPIAKRAPVLQVCPGSLTLVRTPNGSFGTFDVYNRGSSSLSWQAIPPSQACGRGPCLLFDPDAGIVAAGGQEEVPVAAFPEFAGGTTMRVTSPVGTVVLAVEVQ